MGLEKDHKQRAEDSSVKAVRFEQVSKMFTLQHERPRSFQELFLNAVRLRRNRAREPFWALRDVTFEIPAGQATAFIGDNGAGKSTALKLMTRIIEPSSGEIAINGRISALLELGSGFHPELTGRENIYLNGSILGFNRSEVDEIYPDILNFSEMSRFIDVPVKHYSSGMYMRLGFSIAIHVQPDILLVDEVLAVGDQAFQLRCLDRINRMKRQGITIILVTHDLDTVRDLCDRAIWLDDGLVSADGSVDYVLRQYVERVRASDRQAMSRAEGAMGDAGSWRWGSREAEIVRVQFLDSAGQEQRSFATGEPFLARMHYRAKERIETPQFGVALYHSSGFHINGPNTVFSGHDIDAIEGEGYVDYCVESLPLLEGSYLFSATIYDFAGLHAYDHHHQAYPFRVRPSPEIREEYGSLWIPSTWRSGEKGQAAKS